MRADLDRLRSLLAERLGMTFDAKRDDLLAEVLRTRAEQHRMSERDYLDRLTADPERAELRALAEVVTINETYFFRNIEQFHALAEVAIPDRMRARASVKALRLLSVGCSSGEEPYTLAAVTLERVPSEWHVSIVGLDINRAVLRRAAAGRYGSWSLRETPASIRQRWFHARDGGVEVDQRLRARVQFVEHNVVNDDPVLWAHQSYDVIFCRNMLMYLTDEVRRGTIARITRALAPGGYLFLGHTDSLGSRPEGLEVRHTHGTFYYRRTEQAMAPAPAVREPRIPPATPPTAPPLRGYERALSLLREERFHEALTAVESVPAPESRLPRVLVLRGALLAHAGDTGRAAALCERLVAEDALNADAHYVIGVCHEGDASPAAAGRHHQLAAYLDPGFAMPRMRLGMLAKQAGDRQTAARELDRAVTLLRGETDDRILLFGGGFGRQSLIALCRSELQAVGARS
ncbi:protein-glutamate O-methyltransferase CheR [Catenuloplanes atrovinosus]|uniref:protein-glutamate O-methyltransferase n=1 Tax=Catenuloplanes atrovinosus TaxID=137266 RepID=A0AAE3YQ20_9ACTN|nr:protein-glutamate O-methyltransferase CheR [Catenuloplanes atrovinosus]MDR7276249.1 chemotaxis protein methyltransferase CheR [Catenuloplanes atrovinosus]